MYKIFKKKDRMISAVSKLIDAIIFRKQKKEMRNIKISTFLSVQYLIYFFPKYCGNKKYTYRELF